jgi:hypothetical protein
VQKFRINKLAASDHAKRALKRATRWYAQEKDKPGGLSLRQIEKKVKKEYDGVGPCHTTIRRYVNANIAGMSPLKHGVKGDVPPCAFKSLRVAFENTEPPMVDVWTAEDEEELLKISNREIDMSETYLGRYAALQKRNAVAAVLDFPDEEWESLKALREADGAERN